MLNFQTEQLRTFLAVLEHGTFDSAAGELHVTASAVSQRIKAMEQAAGQVLLQRTAPVRATAAGVVVHKLARQLRQLESDCAAELGLAGARGTAIPMVVNADSLATWFVDALAAVPEDAGLSFEVLREDEQHSAGLLRTGEVMAAVTATPDAVQGCSVAPLGSLRYRAVASAGFMARWFPGGFQAQRFPAAPAVQFDRTDTLQDNFLATVAGVPLSGPQQFIPDTIQFARAVELGLGWGLMPEPHCRAGLRAGTLVELVPGRITRVPLYWQRWKIQSPALDVLTAAVTTTAAAALR
ncbi:LysR family transcriptional regulator (chromosome initiation inhibitor) [Arthrobacter silviterrae]|uniref:LysR family transcriptional regulator ArgP n=1 Tax=Arthrobacter silviterrae TaxID=2026658 RepID=UPI00196ABAA5|nr:LysR family transcriptional regulator ArgP [Arthrobacter silviterrae]MDQ0278300.1 LysR family transcriptional regulator (chromosome initiation inhibitor) [Arthrobacter silviterrae]